MEKTKYVVLLENVDRETNSIGDSQPAIQEWFDSEEKARKFYEDIDIASEYKYLCSADKKDHYLEKSLASNTFIYEEDINEWCEACTFRDFIETETAGKHFDDDKRLYLVETEGTREFWTVEKKEGVITLRSLYNDESVDAENCDAVEDDSSWDEIELTDKQYKNLFDGVTIIDERDFD